MAEADYSAEWSVLRRRKRAVWTIFALYIPFMVLIVYGSSIFAQPTGVVIASAFVGFMVVWSRAIFRVTSFICPRCEYLFYGRGIRANAFRRRCSQCDLQSPV